MNQSRVDTDAVVAVVSVVAVIALCGFFSFYAARQGDETLARLCDEALGAPGRRSAWTMLREGPVLGRAVPSAKGRAAYLVTAKRDDGAYRAVVELTQEGAMATIRPLRLKGTAPIRRYSVLLEGQVSRKTPRDSSSLDPMVMPALIDTLETLTRLERERGEEKARD